MRRVLIGADKNGNPGDYSGNSTGIQAALVDGHRWLHFQEANIQITSTIDLDVLTQSTRFLRFDGDVVRGTNLGDERTGPAPRPPMLRALNNDWVFQWQGITFHGTTPEHPHGAGNCGCTNPATYPLPTHHAPMMEVSGLRDSRFEQCGWVEHFGAGLKIGATKAHNVLFQSCEIHSNCFEGAIIDNAQGVDFMKCVIERNGRCDFANIPDLLIDGGSGSERGTSVIRDNHFEADTVDHTFIRLSNAMATDILRNYMLLAGLRLESSTDTVKVARNRFFTDGRAGAGNILDAGTSNDVRRSGGEANIYINNNISPVAP